MIGSFSLWIFVGTTIILLASARISLGFTFRSAVVGKVNGMRWSSALNLRTTPIHKLESIPISTTTNSAACTDGDSHSESQHGIAPSRLEGVDAHFFR
jgi:hypothetical protein